MCKAWGRYNTHTKFYQRSIRNNSSEELGVEKMTILRCIVKRQGVRLWIEFIWLRTGYSRPFCEHRNKRSDTIKGGKYFDNLSDNQRLNKNSAF